ncbi:MAG TPA: hypothetical protein VKE69_10440, partial [Planctomycetota bacterium]|nr:hypothetical protein [Planctomycetota bacterium]
SAPVPSHSEPDPMKPAAPAPAPPPKPEAPAATDDHVRRARSAIEGESGTATPSVDREGTILSLTLRLDHERLEATDAVPQAARLAIRIGEAIPELDSMRVRITAKDKRTLSLARVSLARARALAPQLDDPFGSRRLREYWAQMQEKP